MTINQRNPNGAYPQPGYNAKNIIPLRSPASRRHISAPLRRQLTRWA